MHLSEYFFAVLHHWWPLMSCAAFTILAILVELKQKTSRWAMQISLGLATFFLLFASYQAWNDEYEKTHPGLHLDIDSVGTASTSDTVIVLVIASISNVGSPSIADQWQLEMTPVSGKPITIHPMLIPKDKPMTFRSGYGRETSYDPSDALYLKSASTPVSTGAKETGFMIFALSNVSVGQANGVGTVYKLICSDIFGTKIWAQHTMNGHGERGPMPYYPGMIPPDVEVK
jgi:hypothetical protein